MKKIRKVYGGTALKVMLNAQHLVMRAGQQKCGQKWNDTPTLLDNSFSKYADVLLLAGDGLHASKMDLVQSLIYCCGDSGGVL